MMLRVSRRLSLTSAGSLTTASFGAVSGVVGEVTQSGLGPTAFVAVQPAGRAGAFTLSKFSRQGPVGLGLGTGIGVGEGVGVIVGRGGAQGGMCGSTGTCSTY